MNFLRAVLTGVREAGAAAFPFKAPAQQHDDRAAMDPLHTDVSAPVSVQGSRQFAELPDVQQPSQPAQTQAYVQPSSNPSGTPPPFMQLPHTPVLPARRLDEYALLVGSALPAAACSYVRCFGSAIQVVSQGRCLT